MNVLIHTFGCKANQYDSELIRQALADAGVTVVEDPEEADGAVVNSCTVTQNGEAKMRGFVRGIARKRPGIRTVVMGCAAAVDNGSIAALPNVIKVIPNSDPAAVLRAFDLDGDAATPLLRSFARGSRAWLRIQDGCDEHCTFCATTIARGTSRSKPVETMVEEATLLAQSHAEIVLVGVHIGSYGRDLARPSTLSGLVCALTDRIPDVRFRLSSIEATEVDDSLFDAFRERQGRLAPHLHAPLQSGSDRILKLMGRHWYNSAEYIAAVETLKELLPVLGLGADVMVGFPGETEQDFQETVDLIQRLPFTYLHVFPYSERPGTVARRTAPPVRSDVVAHRSKKLRELAAAKKREYLLQRDGTEADVVLTARRFGRLQGVTEDYLTVDVESTSDPMQRFQATLSFDGDRVVAVPAALEIALAR